MRISYLASAALAVCFLPLAAPAYASCSSPTCGSTSGITYGSGSYNGNTSYGSSNHGSSSSITYGSVTGSHSTGSHATGSHSTRSYSGSTYSPSTRYSSGSSAPCPAGSTRSEGVCVTSGSRSSVGVSAATNYGGTSYSSGSSYTPSTRYSSSSSYAPSSSYSGSSYTGSTYNSNRAPCPAGSTRSSDGVCLTSGTTYSSGTSYSSGATYSSSASYTPSTSYTSSASSNVVPFSTSTSSISNYRIAGMGSNEALSPTTCPTNVYNPGGAKVLGCYSVVKSMPAPRPAPVVVPRVSYQQVRVVRPVVYVRYPVPTPYAVPVYQQQYQQGGCGTTYSRYGNNWPGGCSGW